MNISEIKNLLAPCCQPCLSQEMAAILFEAIANTQGEFVPLPPVLFSGYAGLGKTHAVGIIKSILEPYGYDYLEIPVACNPSIFAKALLDKLSADSPCIIFVDEIHALPKTTRQILKLVTETGGKIKEVPLQLGKDNWNITINPAKHLFIAATNEALKDSALSGTSGRFTALQFMPYNDAGKAVITLAQTKHLFPGFEFTEDTLKTFIENVRPFARSIAGAIRALRIMSRHELNLSTPAGIIAALKASGYIRGGWTLQHLEILRFLNAGPRQVQEIGAGPLKGADQATTQQFLSELMQEAYLRTETGKKIITPSGQAFVKSFLKTKKA